MKKLLIVTAVSAVLSSSAMASINDTGFGVGASYE